MKPMFVQIENGRKDVRWLPLLGSAILWIVGGAAIGGMLASLLADGPGTAAPVVGGLVGLFLAMRQISASIAYQPLPVREDEDAERDVLA